MTRDELRNILKMLTECYPNAKKPTYPKLNLDMWEMAFGEYEAQDVFMAVRYHINHSKFFPTIADIKDAIPKGKMVYGQVPEVAVKKIEAPDKSYLAEMVDYDNIIDLEPDEQCKHCPRRYSCFKP